MLYAILCFLAGLGIIAAALLAITLTLYLLGTIAYLVLDRKRPPCTEDALLAGFVAATSLFLLCMFVVSAKMLGCVLLKHFSVCAGC